MLPPVMTRTVKSRLLLISAAVLGLAALCVGGLVASHPAKAVIPCQADFSPVSVERLHLGFCIPKSGWEISQPTEGKFLTTLFAYKPNAHTSLKFVVGPLPAEWRDNPEGYTRQVADYQSGKSKNGGVTERNIDGHKAFIGFYVDPDDKSFGTYVINVHIDNAHVLQVFDWQVDSKSEDALREAAAIKNSIVFR